jgi:hypothetical protein
MEKRAGPWNTPVTLVYANHSITYGAIRELIKLDRTMRKLKSALSRAQITPETFERAAANLRGALTRFMERVKDLERSFFQGGTSDGAN